MLALDIITYLAKPSGQSPGDEDKIRLMNKDLRFLNNMTLFFNSGFYFCLKCQNPNFQ